MEQLIKDFPQQLLDALDIAAKAELKAAEAAIHNIVVVGMGGSGIGADFAAELTAAERMVPMQSCKSYDLPAYVGPNTLLIASSFSGNTEETLSALEQGIEKGAQVVCISSGGKLIELAKKHNFNHIILPGAGSPPRANLGYSLVQQLRVLSHYGFCSSDRLEDLRQAAAFLAKEQEQIHEKAKRIAGFLVGKTPIVYATDRMAAVALRLRQQFNENGKILCSHHIIPEMNHNELVGWRKQPNEFGVLIFRSRDEHPRNQMRIDINKEIISHYTQTLIEIQLKGANLIEQAMYAVHIGDWLSLETSKLRDVDVTEVKVIDFLKGELAKANANTKSDS